MTMESRDFSLDERDAHSQAEAEFLMAGGFDLGKEKHRKIVKRGRAVLERGLPGISIRGRYALCGGCYGDSGVALGGARVWARPFGLIPAEKVRMAIPFVITAGECSCGEGEPVMDQLLAYMWGTAYVDAARSHFEALLRDGLGMEDGLSLSPPFGPGFYGMDNRDSTIICGALSSERIGVRAKESGVMMPEKTCSGIYLLAESGTEFPSDECMGCPASKEGCAYCMIRNRRLKKNEDRDNTSIA